MTEFISAKAAEALDDYNKQITFEMLLSKDVTQLRSAIETLTFAQYSKATGNIEVLISLIDVLKENPPLIESLIKAFAIGTSRAPIKSEMIKTSPSRECIRVMNIGEEGSPQYNLTIGKINRETMLPDDQETAFGFSIMDINDKPIITAVVCPTTLNLTDSRTKTVLLAEGRNVIQKVTLET